MKIKSLLMGSAAALVAVTGARAADVVVIPEPELVEYVRVCDMYGTGFFYIPGTETCLRISGYVRYEMNLIDDEFGNTGGNDGVDDWGKRSDVRLNFDARNETELGTLRSYIRLGYDSSPRLDGDNDLSGFSIDQAYITLAGFTIGKNTTWWDWGFGEDGGELDDGGPGEVGMVAYTANAGGFAWTLALEEDENDNYTPDVVLDVDGSIGAFGLRAGVAYNESQEAFTAKARASFDWGPAEVGVGFQYSDEDQLGSEYLADYEWVLGADIAADLTEKLSARAGFNYGLDDALGGDGFVIGAGINYDLVEGFDIDARVQYYDEDNFGEGWASRIRFTRTF